MILHLQTLVVALVVISAFLSLMLIFYWADRKTYAGFGSWVIGTLMSTGGYLVLLLRPQIPEGLSILASNWLFCCAAVCKLEGVFRFLRGQPLSRGYYVWPFLTMAACGLFYFGVDLIAIRVFIIGVAVSAFALAMAWQLIRRAPPASRPTYYTSAGLYVSMAVFLMYRSLIWLANPSGDIWNSGNYNTLFFLFMTIFEIGSVFIFLIITGQRTESHLHQTNCDLDRTVAALTKAISEIKTLRGILPICSFCKKIRDDQGYWERVDIYIKKNSAADISHGICPECLRQHYPEEYAAISGKDQDVNEELRMKN